MRVEEEFMDVLQNMEFAIAQVFRNDPKLLDLDVLEALKALIRQHGAGRPPGTQLGSNAQRVFESVRAVCEWRLGRPVALSPDLAEDPTPRNTPDELVACLKRLRSSVDFWNKEAGRQGYLEYISQFIV